MNQKQCLGMNPPPRLPREEWIFDSVPEEERFACLCYEFAREDPRVSRDRKTWLRHFPWGSPWPDVFTVFRIKDHDSEVLNHFHRSLARIALASLQFPATPWQLIPIDDRKKVMKVLDWKSEERNFELCRKFGSRSPITKLDVNLSSFEVRNWGFSDYELIEQFRRWLKETRPASCPPEPSAVGRPHDILKRLGLFRIDQFSKQHKIPRKELTPLNQYGNYDFSRACKTVKEFQATFYRSK